MPGSASTGSRPGLGSATDGARAPGPYERARCGSRRCERRRGGGGPRPGADRGGLARERDHVELGPAEAELAGVGEDVDAEGRCPRRTVVAEASLDAADRGVEPGAGRDPAEFVDVDGDEISA